MPALSGDRTGADEMTQRSKLVLVFLLGLLLSACGSGAAEEADSAATDQAGAAGEQTTGQTTEGDEAATTVTAESLGVPETGEMVDTAEFATEPPWTLGYADASLTNSWRVFAWQYMQWGASQLPETEILRTDANDNTSTQVSDIQDLVARDVDCLIVAATSESALSPVLESLPPDIPVVIMERAVDTDAYASFASLDAVEMGRLQAQAVVDALGGEGDIVILQGVAGSGPVEQSMEGMTSVLDENPGINVLTTEYTDWSRDNGKTAMENALQSFDQIDAVLSDSGLQNVGAFEAVESAGRLDEIKAWTGDTVQAWIRIVHEQELPGIIIDRPTAVGDTAVKTCGAILSGIPVPKVWVTENQVLDPADLEQYIAPEQPGSEQWWDWWTLPEEWLPE
jgi:ribose transport system substrate-binding protein